MNPLHLLRMAKWARKPPSPGRVKLVFGVVIAALAIAGLEYFGFWPEWATLERARLRGFP